MHNDSLAANFLLVFLLDGYDDYTK